MRERFVMMRGFVLVLLLAGGSFDIARAEVYLAAGAGMAFPFDLQHVRGTGAIHGASFERLDLENAGLFGGKVGYFFEDKGLRWMGIEVEGFASRSAVAHRAHSGVQAQSTAVGFGEQVRVVTTALNVLARYSYGRLQPYAGFGLAAVSATVSGSKQSVSDASPGLNLLAGVKVMLTENLAVYCEGKYIYASFQFEDAGLVGAGIKGVYQAPGVVAGVAWHFR